MNFTNAALLTAAVYGLTELAKAVLPNKIVTDAKVVVGLVFAFATASVFLIGATVWAHEQVVGGHPLDQLGVADKFVVALFLGGAAAFLHQGVVTTLRNVGSNAPTKLQQQAFDVAATRVIASQQPSQVGAVEPTRASVALTDEQIAAGAAAAAARARS